MNKNKLPTKFLSAERSNNEELLQDFNIFLNDETLCKIFNSVPEFLIIVNENRQIVFSNSNLLAVLKEKKQENIIGKRPGEALNCIHAFEEEGGCGTSEFCQTCGAAKALLAASLEKKDTQECRITQDCNDALDLKVTTTPFQVQGKHFTIFAASDISHEKRRRTLERIFFHDILNTAGSLRGFVELLEDADEEEIEEFTQTISNISNRMINEIKTQRELNAAENGELTAHPEPIYSLQIIKETKEIYERHEITLHRKLAISEDSVNLEFENDRVLLSRVLENMTKNALEACKDGSTVTLGCNKSENEVEFWVNNPSFMPKEVQLQVFQRSFSTKGAGRGLGTYSMKLLSERYLNGKVTFETSMEKGTTFKATYPLTTLND